MDFGFPAGMFTTTPYVLGSANETTYEVNITFSAASTTGVRCWIDSTPVGTIINIVAIGQ